MNTYLVDDIEKVEAIISLVGSDISYEEALAAYNEIMNRGSLY